MAGDNSQKTKAQLIAELEALRAEIEDLTRDRSIGPGSPGQSTARQPDPVGELRRAIIQTAMDGFWLIDTQGRLLEVNDTYCRMSGYEERELLAMSVADLEAAESEAEVAAHIREIIERGADRFESRHRRKDGSVFDVELAVQYRPELGGRIVVFIEDITERKLVRAALELSERRHRVAASLMVDYIFELELDEKFEPRLTWTSSNLEQITGRSVEESSTIAQWQEIFHPEDFPKAMGFLAEMTAKTAGGEIECRTFLKSGEERWVNIKARPVVDGTGGRAVKIMGSVSDVSARRRAEDALKESENRLRSLSDNLPGGMVYQIDAGVDGETRRFSYISAGVERLHGITAGEAMDDPMTIYGQVLPADLEEVARREAAALENLSPFSAEVQLRLPSGEIRWRHFRSAARRLPDRRLVWDGVEIDITDRKRAEEQIRQQQEMIKAIVESSSDWIWAVDTKNRHTYSNPALKTILGYDPEEIYGRGLDLLHPDDAADLEAQWDKRLEEKKGWRNLVLRWRTREGEYRYLESNAVPIIGGQGEFLGFRGVDRDITDRQRAEVERIKLERLESIGMLAGGIAHDFNNILMGIMGNISMAKLELQSGEDPRQTIAAAEQASHRARDLTRQLLTFARGGAPVKQLTSLADLITETVGFVQRGSNVKCELALAPDLRPASVDPGQIAQVIQNIIINAIQAMPRGGNVLVSAANVTIDTPGPPGPAPGDYIRISIADNGPGMAPEVMDKIFEPYYTTKTGGSGLGLAAGYSIIKRHDGGIAAESEPGRGTVFTIHLPAAEAGLMPERKAESEIRKGQGLILIMDDQDEVRKVAARMLHHLGYQAETAADGAEALAKFEDRRKRGEPYDAVISDLTVPGGMGGQEFIQHLLKLDPGAKVIVASGYSDDPVLANFRDYGFSAMAAKPFKLEELSRVLQAVLP